MKINTFLKTLKIINVDNWKLLLIVFAFVSVSIIDVAGIGMIGPYISLISDNKFLENELVQKYALMFNIPLDFYILFLVISIGLVLIFAMKLIASVSIQSMILKFGYGQLTTLRVKLMASYQLSEYEQYLDQNSSKYIYTIGEITSLYVGYLITSMKALSDLIVSLAILILLAWVDINLLISLILLMTCALYIYDRLIKKKITFYGQQCNASSINMMQGVKEGLEGFKEIRILGKESYFFNLVKSNAEIYSSNQTKLGVFKAVPRYFIEFLMVGFIIVTSVIYIYIGKDLSVILPTLAIFGISAIRLVPAFNSISNAMLQISATEDSISRLYNEIIISNNIKVKNLQPNQKSQKDFREIAIKNLHYNYPGISDVAVLNGIDLNIKQGEFIGITGPSGSGKTTLIDLLLGLLKPVDGGIFFNGIPLEESIESWRSKVSYLPQRAFLIDGSIKDNIALGEINQSIDNNKLNLSLKFSQLSKLIKKLPSGVDTLIGEGGVKISGGQRQRIALARAFYHDKEVLVMDETTSALDDITEREVVKEMKSLSGKATIIIISHSKSLLELCDYVYHLDKGLIVKTSSNIKKVS